MATSPFESGSVINVKPFKVQHETTLRVEILSSIYVGYGATARVYKGRAMLANRPYELALKVIPHVLDNERELLIHRELRIISQLSEDSMPRILPFIGTATVNFHTIIVAEYMRNGNLLEYFRANPDADRQRLIIHVAEAVQWLHDSKNLVHGDLKCASRPLCSTKYSHLPGKCPGRRCRRCITSRLRSCYLDRARGVERYDDIGDQKHEYPSLRGARATLRVRVES